MCDCFLHVSHYMSNFRMCVKFWFTCILCKLLCVSCQKLAKTLSIVHTRSVMLAPVGGPFRQEFFLVWSAQGLLCSDVLKVDLDFPYPLWFSVKLRVNILVNKQLTIHLQSLNGVYPKRCVVDTIFPLCRQRHKM